MYPAKMFLCSGRAASLVVCNRFLVREFLLSQPKAYKADSAVIGKSRDTTAIQCKSPQAPDNGNACKTTTKTENASECKTASKVEKASECKTAPKVEKANDCKVAPKVEKASECKTAPKVEKASECKTAPKVEKASECKAAPKVEKVSECKTAPKVEKASECKTASKVEKANECKVAPKVEKARECKTAPKVEKASECKAAPKVEKSKECKPKAANACNKTGDKSKGKEVPTPAPFCPATNQCPAKITPAPGAKCMKLPTGCDTTTIKIPPCVPPKRKGKSSKWMRSYGVFLLKASIAGGVVYWTVREGVWGNSDDTMKIYEKMRASFKEMTKDVFVEVPGIRKQNVPKVESQLMQQTTQLWNSGVVHVFNFVTAAPAKVISFVKTHTGSDDEGK